MSPELICGTAGQTSPQTVDWLRSRIFHNVDANSDSSFNLISIQNSRSLRRGKKVYFGRYKIPCREFSFSKAVFWVKMSDSNKSEITSQSSRTNSRQKGNRAHRRKKSMRDNINRANKNISFLLTNENPWETKSSLHPFTRGWLPFFVFFEPPVPPPRGKNRLSRRIR